jgi:hypothetical protein
MKLGLLMVAFEGAQPHGRPPRTQKEMLWGFPWLLKGIGQIPKESGKGAAKTNFSGKHAA